MLKSLIRDPAITKLEANIAAAVPTARDDTNPATILATMTARYTELKDWLTNTYFGEQEKRIVMNSLPYLK